MCGSILVADRRVPLAPACDKCGKGIVPSLHCNPIMASCRRRGTGGPNSINGPPLMKHVAWCNRRVPYNGGSSPPSLLQAMLASSRSSSRSMRRRASSVICAVLQQSVDVFAFGRDQLHPHVGGQHRGGAAVAPRWPAAARRGIRDGRAAPPKPRARCGRRRRTCCRRSCATFKACARAASSASCSRRRSLGGMLVKPEPAHQCRQHQPLADQRDDDDAESDEQNEIAIGKRRARRGGQRNSQSRRQRDDAAHADKAQEEQPLPRRHRIAARQRRAQPARQITPPDTPR